MEFLEGHMEFLEGQPANAKFDNILPLANIKIIHHYEIIEK